MIQRSARKGAAPAAGRIQARLAEAVAAHRRGRLELAEPIYRDILRKAPDHADALHLLGLVAHQRGDQAEAVRLIGRAMRLDPAKAAYANSIGLALLAQGRPDEAAASHSPWPLPASRTWRRRTTTSATRGWPAATPVGAIAAYRRAIALRGDYAEAHANLAAALRRTGDLAAAGAAAERALAIRPDYVGALCTLGLIRHEQGEYEAALGIYDRALALDPQHATTRANRATLLLLLGRMEDGWREYEWRWRAPGFTTKARDFGSPAWDGSDLSGRTILIHAEQGLGSAIQFVRYAPLVAARGGRVILECQPPLARLFASLAGSGVEAIVRKGEPLPEFDVHAPLMSLPRLFATTLTTIPNAVPYLAAEEGLRTLWRERLAHLPAPRVGLVWAGNPNHANDRNRSLPARLLAPLFGLPRLLLRRPAGGRGRGRTRGSAPRGRWRRPARSPTLPTPPRSSPNSSWSSRWIPPSPTSPGRWRSRSGCCCRSSANGAGLKFGPTRPGIRPCGCSASRAPAIGRVSSRRRARRSGRGHGEAGADAAAAERWQSCGGAVERGARASPPRPAESRRRAPTSASSGSIPGMRMRCISSGWCSISRADRPRPGS